MSAKAPATGTAGAEAPATGSANGGATARGARSPAATRASARPLDLMGHPGHLARRLQQASYTLWTAMVSDEVTAPQFVVLNVLCAEPDIDQRTLGERASLDRSTVADVVARLVRRGLVERVRDTEDRRRNVLQLTSAGRLVLSQVGGRTAAMNRALLAPLALDEQAIFLGLMRRLVEGGERLRARP